MSWDLILLYSHRHFVKIQDDLSYELYYIYVNNADMILSIGCGIYSYNIHVIKRGIRENMKHVRLPGNQESLACRG